MSKGGILFGDDWERLAWSLATVVQWHPHQRTTIIEIGVDDGRTANEMMVLLWEWRDSGSWQYIGVDPSPKPARLEDQGSYYRHHQMLSHEAIDRIEPIKANLVFVDGCHCAQCVARDAFLYGRLLIPGGLLLFHDAAPATQGLDPQDYPGDHHDRDVARSRGIDVRRFLDAHLLGGFRLVQKAPDAPRGGIEIYEKIA